MKNKITSRLWFRLVLYFLFLSLTILVLTQLVYNYSLDNHISRYVQEQEEAVNRQIIGSFESYYESNMTWAGSHMAVYHISNSTNTRLALYNPDGDLVSDSSVSRGGHRMMERGPGRLLPEQNPEDYHYAFVLEVEDEAVGELLITHLERERGFLKEQDLLFRDALGGSLWWTTLLATAFALILSVFFSRLLSQPLVTMAKVVNEVEKGALDNRLPVYSIGELQELSQSFNSLAEHLQTLEALRKRSTADLSHELRTPLTTLRSYLEAFEDGVLVPDKETLKTLHEEVMYLSQVVTDLDELSQAESLDKERNQHQAAEYEVININELLKEKVAFFQPQFQGKDLRLALVLPNQEINVCIEPLALGKIMGNLLSNAFKYTPAGGKVTVSLDPRPDGEKKGVDPLGENSLRVPTGPARGEMVLIMIEDNGIGIKEEDLPFIFERFFRADPSRGRSSGGSGIGLALVKELVHSCGGEIRVQSEEGKGTTFFVYLPAG